MSPSCPFATVESAFIPIAKRVVLILGLGRDRTYLRYQFRGKEGRAGNDDDVRWFGVDHPLMTKEKVCVWLPRCNPEGYNYDCIGTKQNGDKCGDKDCKGNGDSSNAIAIALQTGGVNNNNAKGRSYNDGSMTKTKKADHRHTMRDASSSSSSPLTMSSNYHVIGQDLRSSPDSLFQKLARPGHGYDELLPALFVLECFLMYLPETLAQDLLHRIAASPALALLSSSLSSSSFVVVAIYNPIPRHNRFGQLMMENLKWAGITGGGGGGGGSGGGGRKEDDYKHGHDDRREWLLSLEGTRTLTDQLARLVRTCGFDVALCCNMVEAYNHGVVRSEDRERAMQCEALDKLEEFLLLMRHYCLLMGIATLLSRGRCASALPGWDEDGGSNVGIWLCSVGSSSPMGFREGQCTAMKRSDRSDERGG
jgi:hypothetical protein